MRTVIYKKLYLSEDLQRKEKRVRLALRLRRAFPILYVITLSNTGTAKLVFYSSLHFKQVYERKKQLFVVGVASGYDEALYIIEQIVNDVYSATGDLDYAAYFQIPKEKE